MVTTRPIAWGRRCYIHSRVLRGPLYLTGTASVTPLACSCQLKHDTLLLPEPTHAARMWHAPAHTCDRPDPRAYPSTGAMWRGPPAPPPNSMMQQARCIFPSWSHLGGAHRSPSDLPPAPPAPRFGQCTRRYTSYTPPRGTSTGPSRQGPTEMTHAKGVQLRQVKPELSPN